jgi:uncharacterized protein YkwD
MSRFSPSPLCGLLAALYAVAASSARADALGAVQMLREGGCGGIVPAAPPLRHDAQLDLAAAEWAAGRSLTAAAEASGYHAGSTTGLRVSGPDDFVVQELRRSRCQSVASRNLRDVGVYRRGSQTWLVLASATTFSAGGWAPGSSAELYPATAPRSSYAADLRAPASGGSMSAARALELVNEVRARGTRCGTRDFAPAAPLTLSRTLAGVAFGHAADMAEHDYFEHVDRTGQSPADRVRAVGYRERLVGENIAYGPESVDEVVKGWLDSPEHCENIMDPRFEQMGFAYATGQGSRRGLYWVQVFAEPRT